VLDAGFERKEVDGVGESKRGDEMRREKTGGTAFDVSMGTRGDMMA
jgi:hypothetical protein